MVQYAIFTDKLNNIFPLNIIIIYMKKKNLFICCISAKMQQHIFFHRYSAMSLSITKIYIKYNESYYE